MTQDESYARLCRLLCVFLLTRHVVDTRYLPSRNPGDRYGLFLFRIPTRYINSTLGPETYGWLVRTFGQITVDQANISRAPSDSHTCGTGGWCRGRCSGDEWSDWRQKDVCGRFRCCVKATRDTSK